MLDIFGLIQIVTKPTRVTTSSRTLIDHILTNQALRITNTGIIPCSIVSDHDGPFVYIKQFVEHDFIDDFAGLPLSLVYSTEVPDEQLEYFNSMFCERLERHAPLRRVRVTRPSAPWMNNDEIRSLQQTRDKLCREAQRKLTRIVENISYCQKSNPLSAVLVKLSLGMVF